MNKTQLTTTLAPLVTFFAGLLAGKGVFGWDAQTWATIIGGVLGLIGTVIAANATKTSSIVAATDAVESTTVTTTDPALAASAGIELKK